MPLPSCSRYFKRPAPTDMSIESIINRLDKLFFGNEWVESEDNRQDFDLENPTASSVLLALMQYLSKPTPTATSPTAMRSRNSIRL